MDRREKDFSMALSDLGEPEDWWTHARHGYPGFAKWIVQESPRGQREPYFHSEGSIDGREAEVHFTGKTLDGTVFASSRENDAPLMFIPTQEDVMEGFSLAISSMEEGEKAIFTIPAELTLTKSGCPANIPWNIPPNQTLRFDIELISLTTDVLGDQGIMKKTTKVGVGDQRPCDLDEVFVKYNACLKDGTSVSKSEGVEFSLPEAVTLGWFWRLLSCIGRVKLASLARGFFCLAFAHAVKTMTEGDEAFLVIKPEYGFGEQGRPSMGNEPAVPPGATLYVNLQLMSWKTVSHIGENREILKTTFGRAKFGGEHAQEGALMKLRLIGKLQDGTVFDRRGHDGEVPLEFTIGKENFVNGLKEAVMTMVEGDVASVIIPPQHAFGTAGSNQYKLAVVPPNSTVMYEIELLSVEPWLVPFSFSRRRLKQARERHDRLMIAVPPAAVPQGNASQPLVLTAPAAAAGQSPPTGATPAIGSGSATIASVNNQSSGNNTRRWKPNLGSCFGFSFSSTGGGSRL